MRGTVFSLSRAAGTAILGSSLLLEWGLYARATIDSPNRAPWDASLPAHIAQNGHIWPTWLSILLMLITVAQVTILYSIGSGQKKPMSPLSTSFTCVVTVVVAIAALRTSYLTSNDVYAYIGYAKLQTVRDAYVPPNTNLPPPFTVIHRIWNRPLTPAAYGPLELEIYHVAVGSTSTMGGALFAARCVGFAAVVVLALLVFALTQKLELVPLVLLNPGIYQQSVIDAHNDILAVDMTLLALLLAKRSAIAATLAASLSGLVKINFSLIGSVLATSRFRSGKRLAAFAISFALTLLLSYLFSGYSYIGALAAISNEYVPKFGTASGAVGTLTHIALVPFAFAALTLVFLGFETPWSFVWSFPSLAVAVYPGYLIWGLPYALRDVNSTRFFLAALPLPSLMFNFVFPGSGDLMRIILLLYMVYEAFKLLRTLLHSRGAGAMGVVHSPSQTSLSVPRS